MTFASRTSLALLAAASALAAGLSLAHAQEGFGRIGPNSVLVTPQGEILDYIPDAADVRVMRDGRGRQVLVDSWGNIVATVMGSRQRPDGFQPRPAQRNGTNRGYGYSEPAYSRPGEATSSVPDYRDYRDPTYRDTVPGVERGELPASLPENSIDENDQAALPADEPSPSRLSLPQAATITRKSSAEITALQVFLDREGFSPGVIDGKTGANVTKAIEAWQQSTGETLDPNNTDDILERLRLSGGLPITSYTISAADAAGPYVASIPEDYAHKAVLPHLSFTSTAEMLGEKFHMDEGYLRELNPGVDFTVPGTIIKVISPGEMKKGKVTRIVADKARKQVFAYDEAGVLIAAYPATIGSSDTPSPSGTVQVDRIAFDPGYTYNPKINFKQGENDKILTLQPGPNGPVGTVWIALSKPTYGIHGTPEPSKIGKTQSHGCVRLTNWDATELAKMVSVGTTVEFID